MNVAPRLSTQFLLMAQYGALPVIPVETVCRDYFPHLTAEKFLRKVRSGDIAIPVMAMETSQKSAKGVHIQHLADYIDALKEAAFKECKQLNGRIGIWLTVWRPTARIEADGRSGRGDHTMTARS